MKFIRVLVFVFFCVFLCFVFGTKVSAQECTNINESEFHSLRPYPGKPCLDVISETATFCGDSLTITDNIPITYRPSVDSCISIPGGKVRCTYSKNQNRNITINLSEAELPIMGNTEDVTPNASPDMSDAQKVNEYVSWYLNGVINRKEYPEKTDNTSLVNFSGPIAKLLPQQIQQAERVRTIERGTGKDVNGDGETSPRDRHNQIAVCYKIENDLNFLPSILRWALEHLGIGKAVPADCPGNDKMRLDEWNGHLSFYNQIIATGLNLAEFFAKLMPSVASDAIEGALADNEPWPYRVPPLPWGNAPSGEPFDSLTYQKAYNEWLGKTCLLIPFPRFLICTENFLVPNIYADLFPFVPLSSTEDRKGEVTAAGSVGSAPGVTISNVSTSFTNATLYFAHMQEATELASTLQDTFTYKGADKFATGNSVPVNTAGSCKIVDVRSNAGDSLMPSPSSITGNIAYTATFTCDFNSSSSCSGTCVPSQLECRDGGGTGGTGSCSGNWYCCNFSAPTPPAEQNCTKVIPITINTTTETPIADKIWAQLVSGTSSVFRRIFPKLGSGSQIGEVKDIPASTKVTYSGDVSGNGELKFPHIGGISEYFLKGIQTMLRPKGYGEAISFGETSVYPTPPPGSIDICSELTNCNQNPNLVDLTGVKEKFIDLATRWLGVGHPRIDIYDTVISSAQAAGVDPIFTLAIWLNESGASNYDGACQVFGHGDPSSINCQRAQDFGINKPDKETQYNPDGSIIVDHFMDQLQIFLGLPNYYYTSCKNNPVVKCPMEIFGAMFKWGVCTPTDNSNTYIAGILGIYDWLKPSQVKPCYPIALPQ